MPSACQPRKPCFRFSAREQMAGGRVVPRNFSCKLDSRRCTARNPRTDKQCSRMVTKSLPYCWQHNKLVARVVIKPSGIRQAGLGLFACDSKKHGNAFVFKQGDFIAPYNAPRVRPQELTRRYGKDVTGPYAYSYKTGRGRVVYLDAACARSLAAYANDARDERNNAELDRRGQRTGLYALRNIRNGEEIFTSYGPSYWQGVEAHQARSSTSNISRITSKC